jgi:nucleotide-binding universal stress UspA family protein
VVDADREMARIEAAADEQLRRLSANLADVAVERVVRFGALLREISIEAEVFAADLIAVTSSIRPTIRHHLLAWSLRYMTRDIRSPVVLLPAGSVGSSTTRDALAMATLRHI